MNIDIHIDIDIDIDIQIDIDMDVDIIHHTSLGLKSIAYPKQASKESFRAVHP